MSREKAYFTIEDTPLLDGVLLTSSFQSSLEAAALSIDCVSVQPPKTQVSFLPPTNTQTDWAQALAAGTTNILYRIQAPDRFLGNFLSAKKADFSDEMKPLVLMGTGYVPPLCSEVVSTGRNVKARPETLEMEILKEFRRLIWATYRSNFQHLSGAPGSGKVFDSDVGWGCTLRVGQMMIMETLRRRRRDYGPHDEKSLLSMLQENRPDAKLSIHSLLHTAKTLGKYPGDWFSPASVAYLLQIHMKKDPLEGVEIVVQVDSTLYIDQVVAAATGLQLSKAQNFCFCAQRLTNTMEVIGEDSQDLMDSYLSDPSSSENLDDYEEIELNRSCKDCHKALGPMNWRCGVLLLVPLMLGLKGIKEYYFSAVKTLLNVPQTVGIIGGKPKSAYYIVGYQGDNLIYLDPHYVQSSCHTEEDMDSLVHTYHCSEPRLLPMSEAESSMAAGFYLEDESSFRDLIKRLELARSSLKSVIHVVETGKDLSDVDSSANCVFFEKPQSSGSDYFQV